jgi:hypothetical protein
MSFISINIDFRFLTETLKVLLEWLSSQCSRTSVQFGPTIERHNIDGLGVQYTLTRAPDSIPTIHIVDLICRARKLRRLFRECSGTLKETHDYLRLPLDWCVKPVAPSSPQRVKTSSPQELKPS